MTTATTIATIIRTMASEMGVLPRVSMLETDPEILAARKAAGKRFHAAYWAGCRKLDAAVQSMSIVQAAKLDEIMSRLGYYPMALEGHPHAISAIVHRESSPEILRRLADDIDHEISAMAA